MSRRTVRYECPRCTEPGSAYDCCAECRRTQSLASSRSAPFDSALYETEVLCPGCDEILKEPPFLCKINSRGVVSCKHGGCNVPTYVTIAL
jgi:hypothetical protein